MGQPLPVLSAAIIACLAATSVIAQPAVRTHGAAGAPLSSEPSAKIIIDSPLAEGLSLGAAVVHYRAENLRIAPLFGAAALSLSPRVGHVHVNVDGAPWVWAHTSGEPVIVVGLSPGPHKIRLELMTANHQWLYESAVEFTQPATQESRSAATHLARRVDQAPVQSFRNQAPARIIMDSPLPEPLSRGVVFIRYRTENLDLESVPGSARIGHIHVSVDDARWHWADASGNPVIVQGLTPGRHKILIELADDIDQVIDHATVDLTIPALKSQ
jgi:hypothetical protein